ncbi:MAG: septum formation initiator family protein [Acidobacteriota bacterium]
MKPGRAQLAWALVVLVWLPMAALLIWGPGGVLALMALRKQVQSLQVEIQTLQQENGQLKEEIRKLKTDPDTYEKLARELFFLKKPGEQILYLSPADPAPSQSPRGGAAGMAPAAETHSSPPAAGRQPSP